MAFSEVKYAWQCSVNVANFVTVRPSSEGDDETNKFKDWKEQMICLLESRDVMGFVNGEIVAPEKEDIEQYKLWRRTDRLAKGWILGSVATDVLHQLRGSETARDVWLQLQDNIFKQKAEKKVEEEVEGGGKTEESEVEEEEEGGRKTEENGVEEKGGRKTEEGGKTEEKEVEEEGGGGGKNGQFSFSLQFPSFELNSDFAIRRAEGRKNWFRFKKFG